MHKVAEEGRKQQQFYKEENKYSSLIENYEWMRKLISTMLDLDLWQHVCLSFLSFRWQERWARNQRGKGVFTDEELRQILERNKLRGDHVLGDFEKMKKLDGLLPSQAEEHYGSFEKFFVAQLDKIFPSKRDVVPVTSEDPKTRKKEGKRGQTSLLFDESNLLTL